jgi:hypothetical protein
MEESIFQTINITPVKDVVNTSRVCLKGRNCKIMNGRNNVYYIVKLEEGVWIAPWNGDPGRTVIEYHAKKFLFSEEAERYIAKARRYRAFPDAEIVPRKSEE